MSFSHIKRNARAKVKKTNRRRFEQRRVEIENQKRKGTFYANKT